MTDFEIGQVPVNKMPVDEDCFDTLSDEKAWLLGWLFADSHLRIKDGYHALSIETIDEQVVKTFLSVLNAKHRVLNRQRGNGKPTMSVNIYGLRTLGPKLEDFGLKLGGKSERLPPNIADRYYGPFIRGYFDGDGSVTSRPLSKGGRLRMNIKGPPEILLWIKEKLQSVDIAGNQGWDGNSFYIAYGIKASLGFYRRIYHEGCVCLERKKARFEDFVNRGGDVQCPVSTKVGF